MSYIHTKHTRANRQRSHALRRKVQTGPVAVSFIAIITIGILSFFYLYEQNNISTKGYTIRELEKQVDEIKEQNRKLELEVAKVRSIEEIEKSAGKLNMVKIQKFTFVERTEPSVAVSVE